MRKLILIIFIFCSIDSMGQNFFWSYASGRKPSVTTATTSSISYTTATSGGNVTLAGITNQGAAGTISERGICWNTSSDPTISNSHTSDGTGTGSFTSSLTGLTDGASYYVRAYATNQVGTAYGQNESFNTPSIGVPTVTTTAITTIRRTTATGGGNVTSDGGASVTDRGVCVSQYINPIYGGIYQTSDGTGTGVYTSSITGRTDNTLYYVRAYAINSVGVSYGSNVTFTTDPDPCTASIGDNYGGGKIIYFLQLGDTGYDAGICHGLIMSENLGQYPWGCQGAHVGMGSEAWVLGRGQTNTTIIVNGCADSNIAAKICNDLVLNGYSDWYLPSVTEATKMWNVLSSTESGVYYWNSCEGYTDWNTYALYSVNSLGGQELYKSTSVSVRAIRSF